MPEVIANTSPIQYLFQLDLEEARRLPENLASQVYDFIRFIEARHGIRTLEEDSQHPEWESFFERHTRTVTKATPLSRDEIYAERLR